MVSPFVADLEFCRLGLAETVLFGSRVCPM